MSNLAQAKGKIEYQLIQSYSGMWHVYNEQCEWVSVSWSKIGAKLSARWDVRKRRRPEPPVPPRFSYWV